MNASTLTFGSDPELMLIDKDGNLDSAIRVLKNDKHTPIDIGNGVKLYADNVLAECSFPPQSSSSFSVAVGDMLTRMANHVMDTHRIKPVASAAFPKRLLMSKRAREAGCNDNFGAYNPIHSLVNPKVKFDSEIRTGSFHLHIGNPKYKDDAETFLLTNESRVEAIKMLDAVLGVLSVALDKDDSSLIRRKYYGKAGEYRPTSYGIEYRVLGPYFMQNPSLVSLVSALAEVSMALHAKGIAPHAITNPIVAMDIINNCKRDAAYNHSSVIFENIRYYLGSNISVSLKERFHELDAAGSNTDLYTGWGISTEKKVVVPVGEVPKRGVTITPNMVVANTTRAVLNEGRRTGPGFAFLHLKEGKAFEVNPPSTCKDYMNDVLYSEIFGKPVKVYGLSTAYTGCMKDGNAYFIMRCLDSLQGSEDPNKDKIIASIKDPSGIKDMVDKVESTIGIDASSRAIISNIDESTLLFEVGKQWLTSTWILGLLLYSIRVGVSHKVGNNIFDSARENKDHHDQPYSTYFKMVCEYIASNGFPIQRIDHVGYSPHGMGMADLYSAINSYYCKSNNIKVEFKK